MKNNENYLLDKKDEQRKERGITLIALVVTIVVLLILAGITITMVLGEDGIIAQAKLAAEKTRDAEEQQEKDFENLVGDLENILSAETEENMTPSPSPEPPKELTEEEKNQITIGPAEDTEDYGKKVNEYSANGINTWRLFYKDSKYTYIIADTLVNQTESLETVYKKAGYENVKGNNVSTIGQKLNSKFTNFKDTNENKNIKAIAYLTDPKNWQEYKTGNAVYAIGRPNCRIICSII